MLWRVLTVVGVLWAGLAATGCGSRGDTAAVVETRTGDLVAVARPSLPPSASRPDAWGDEAYRGPLVAAVVTGTGPQAEVSRRLALSLAEGGVFAAVLPITAVSEAFEAEIIIMPAVIEARPGTAGFDRVSLRVRTWRKGTGEVGLDQLYQGSKSRRGDAVADASAALNQDLARRYGARGF